MTMNKGTYKKLMGLLNEVGTLAAEATRELDDETRWTYEDGKHANVKVYPNGAPDNASQMMGSKTTGALRRRSMDLTRLLAEMRKSA